MENIDRNKFIVDYYVDGKEFYLTVKNVSEAVSIAAQLITSEGKLAGDSFAYGYADEAGKTTWDNIYKSMLAVGMTTEEIALFTVEIASFFTQYAIVRMRIE